MLLLLLSTVASVNYDLVVFGSTPSGISAALSYKNMTPEGKVAVIEPTPYVGGMSGAGGIGFRDYATPSPCCTMVEWGMMNAAHYNVTYPVWQPDNFIGHENFKKLLSNHKVELYTSEAYVSGSVKQSSQRITSFTTTTDTWTATAFVDASYEGLIMREVTSFTWGREAVTEYNESMAGVPPKKSPTYPKEINGYYANTTKPLKYVSDAPELPVGSSDLGVMGYSYRCCVTNNAHNKVAFPKPDGYDELDFELMNRYVNSLSSPPSIHNLFGILDYRSFPPKNKWDLCDAGGSPVTSDVVDETIQKYMNGSQADQKEVARAVQYYVQGFLYWLGNSDNSPAATRKSVQSYGLCADEWPENGHIPPQLYVREALRMVGDHVFAQPEWQKGGNSNRSIGMGGWGIDIHVVHRKVNKTTGIIYDEGWTSPGTGQHPFHLPVDLILPKKSSVQNLFVTSAPSCSHVTWAGIREEPTLWLLGMAAGTTASLVKEGPVQDVEMAELQKSLRMQGINIPTTGSQ
eukprot:TRINITY_DN14345_c0_g1_i1.p1 TRINITY_DN14345_c0_g1~~TRINITY_DN14345_c0_g1_i1.p1  ORF type:complete len:532 (+),score=117.79 TRINITY_DN14345_c0_g1_i1:48-1598(+)